MKLTRGAISRIIPVFVGDSRSNAGAGLTGLTYSTAGLVATYKADTAATPTVLTLVTAAVGTWTSSGFAQIDAANQPGWYGLHLPDAALATGKLLLVELHGAANMVPVAVVIELDAIDYQASGGKVPATVAAADVTGLLPADVRAVTASTQAASGLFSLGSDYGAGTLPVSIGGDLTGTVGALAPQAQADVQSAMTAQGYTTARAAHLDADVSAVPGLVWAYSGSGGRTIAGGNNVTLASGEYAVIATAVGGAVLISPAQKIKTNPAGQVETSNPTAGAPSISVDFTELRDG